MRIRPLLAAAAVVALPMPSIGASSLKPRAIVLQYTPEGDALPAAQAFASSRRIH
jgi:hypothetical protein